jgi:hypothetical protein
MGLKMFGWLRRSKTAGIVELCSRVERLERLVQEPHERLARIEERVAYLELFEHALRNILEETPKC